MSNSIIIIKLKIGTYPEKDWLFCELNRYLNYKRMQVYEDTSMNLILFDTAIISV